MTTFFRWMRWSGLAAACLLAWVLQAGSPVEQANELLPRLADPDLKARYAAKMELQRLCLEAAAPGHGDMRRQLAAWLADEVVRSDLDSLVRQWLLRQIQYIGRDETVPALAMVLKDPDPHVRECARRALEVNPSPAVFPVLLEALSQAMEEKAEARWRIGLVHSLGERASGSAMADRAVPVLERALQEPDTQEEAARTLGRLGTPRAWQVLQDAMNRIPEAGRALIEAAREAEPDQARELYGFIWRECIHRGPRAAALVGLARVAPEETAPLVAAALDDPDPWLRQAALNAAEAMGGLGQEVLVSVLPDVPETTLVAIIGRLEAPAWEALVALLEDPQESVRLAAIQRLGQVGREECVAPLLERAVVGGKTESAFARRALARLAGRPVDHVLRTLVQGGEDTPEPWRVLALQALVERNSPGVGELLMNCARADGELRKTALEGLARLGGEAEFLPLAELVAAKPSREGWRALERMAERIQDGPAMASRLLEQVGDRRELRLALLGTLARLGGPQAIEVAGAFARSTSESESKAGIEALSQMADPAGVQLLLALAADQTVEAARAQAAFEAALEGIDRLSKRPPAERAPLVLEAFKVAGNPVQKRRVLALMGQTPTASVAEALAAMLEDQTLGKEAMAAAVSVAEALRRSDAAAARALAQKALKRNPPAPIARRLQAVIQR